MAILAALILTILPGSWVFFGLRITGIPSFAKLAMAIALSPSIVGLQLAALEGIGFSFATSAYALVLLNIPCSILLVRRLRAEIVIEDLKSLLMFAPFLVLIPAIPIIIWSSIPGLRTYEWETMLQTDIVYTIARNGVFVEEANLAGLNLAYGWIGHSYWSLIGWIGDWAPTLLYPFTNILWIFVTFILSYYLGRSGLGLHKTTAVLGTVLLFLGTNVIGILLRITTGRSPWWERYFGDIRYSPFLSKFYTFDTMLWGMALLIAITLAYTVALRRRVTPLGFLTIALLISLGIIYPVLFPAGLFLAVCFMFLTIVRFPNDLPEYTRWDMARLGFAILFSGIVVSLYLGLVTANRDIAIFTHSGRHDILFKFIRFAGAMGPFIVMAALPFIDSMRSRHGPALLLALSAMAFSAVYVFIDLAHLEYKYVLAATICLVFLAVTALDPSFKRRPRAGRVTNYAILAGLVAINLLLVLKAQEHIPGNLEQGASLNECSFWIALSLSEPDSTWTKAIFENTSENTVVVADKPGVKLSVLVGRSMYFPSDLDGAHLPGYNLNQRFYLLQQRGYPTDVYDRRLSTVETFYTIQDEAVIIKALQDLKELHRPIAIYFPSQDIYSLSWLKKKNLGRTLYYDGQNTVWLIEDPDSLP